MAGISSGTRGSIDDRVGIIFTVTNKDWHEKEVLDNLLNSVAVPYGKDGQEIMPMGFGGEWHIYEIKKDFSGREEGKRYIVAYYHYGSIFNIREMALPVLIEDESDERRQLSLSTYLPHIAKNVARKYFPWLRDTGFILAQSVAGRIKVGKAAYDELAGKYTKK